MMRNDDWSAIEELYKNKRMYIYTCALALLCSLVISLSIPKQYVSRIIVAPETKFLELEVGAPKGSILASMKDNSAWSSSGPDVYIEYLRTPDLREEVKKLRVKTGDGDFTGTYEEYLNTRMDYPWYYNIFYNHTIDDIVDDNVKYYLDRGNATITIQVSSCDAHLSASMPDMIKELLQERIALRFRNLYTNRAVDFAANLEDAQKDYEAKFREYTSFKDSHEGIKDKTYMTVQTSLQRDMRNAQAVCEKLRELKRRCEMLAEKNDVYLTTVINSTVARSATNPHYVANALIWIFYSLIFTSLFILYRKKFTVKKEGGTLQ